MPNEQVDYDVRQHRVFRSGRALSSEVVQLWLDAVAAHAPKSCGRLIDVGCGTGRFSAPLASRLGCGVVGVEPSAGMLAQADTAPSVSYVQGRAEALPVTDEVLDVAWLSMVAHHLDDLAGVAAELRRVLRPGGVVFIRNVFGDRLPERLPLFDYFPSALDVERRRMPTSVELIDVFAQAGLIFAALETISQQIDDSLAAHADRLAHRALSALELISDEEFEAGLAALRHDATTLTAPVIEDIDLLVLTVANS